MDTKATLTSLLDTITDLLADCDKFDAGNDSAGRRLRAGLLNVRNSCTEIRKQIQETRTARKSKD
jgi:hypothetical protein